MKKSEAVSDFAKSKTMKEQREFLPIYSVREELLNVIRDNQVRAACEFACDGCVVVCGCECWLQRSVERHAGAVVSLAACDG